MPKTARLLYFSGDLVRNALDARKWSLARLSAEIYNKTGVEAPTSTLSAALQAGVELDEDGVPRFHHQPNATLTCALLLVLDLTAVQVMAKL